MPKNIASYTPPVPAYPPYLSVNADESGNVSITVRGAAKPNGECGDTATIVIPRIDFRMQVVNKLMKAAFSGQDD